MLNSWIDYNADGDWDDAGEQVLADQALSDGVNNLTIAIPANATAGTTFVRHRLTSGEGYSYTGLAPDGEVEDYQVSIVAAKSTLSRLSTAPSFNLWTAFVAQPSSRPKTSVAPQRDLAAAIWRSVEPASPTAVDLALEAVASPEHRPTRVRAGFAFLDEQLADRVFEEEMGFFQPPF